MAKIEIDEILDSDQKSNMSGKDTPDPEKEIMATEQDIDVEKQAQGLNEPEQITKSNGEDHDPNIVEFDGPDDPDDPKNWSPRRKMSITASMGGMTFTVTFSSSIFAVCLGPVSEEFNVGTVVAALGVCLFLLVSLITLLECCCETNVGRALYLAQ